AGRLACARTPGKPCLGGRGAPARGSPPARHRAHARGAADRSVCARVGGSPFRVAVGNGPPGGAGRVADRRDRGALRTAYGTVESHWDGTRHGPDGPGHATGPSEVSHVLVMAKAPVPGRVKTRLCPPCTPTEAAALAEAALADTLDAVAACHADRFVVAL